MNSFSDSSSLVLASGWTFYETEVDGWIIYIYRQVGRTPKTHFLVLVKKKHVWNLMVIIFMCVFVFF